MHPSGEPAVFVRRASVVESVHRAIVAAVEPEGRVVARLGDVDSVTYLRSAAKPFQALALVESGAADAFDVSSAELAIVAGSHGGEDRHVKLVEGLLAKADVGPEALKCGTHKPYHGPTAARIGEGASQLHHNCSGKHAGMLLLARHLGEPFDAYIEPKSPGQRRIRKVLAEVAGLTLAKVQVGTDGCSAPNFAMPLRNGALAFARLGAPERSPAHGEGLRRVRDAMLAHPAMVAGEGRLDTVLMESFGGTLVSKSGAEGVQGAAYPSKGLGVLVKVEDGSARATAPATVEALRQLRIARPAHVKALEPLLGKVQKNWAGLEVGTVDAEFTLRTGPRRR